MDIWFRCEQCGKSLVADEKGRGYSVNCPDCGNTLLIPETSTTLPYPDEPTPTPQAESVSVPDKPKLQLKRNPNNLRTKLCPYCAEEIEANTAICRHCGETLEILPAPVPQRISSRQVVSNYRSITYGQVPWSRREGVLNVFTGLGFGCWLLVSSLLAFLLLLFPSIMALTGDVYRKKPGPDGEPLRWGWNWKLGPVVLCLLTLILTIFHIRNEL